MRARRLWICITFAGLFLFTGLEVAQSPPPPPSGKAPQSKKFARYEIERPSTFMDYILLHVNLDLLRFHFGGKYLYDPPDVGFDVDRQVFTAKVRLHDDARTLTIGDLRMTLRLAQGVITGALGNYVTVSESDLETEFFRISLNNDAKNPGFKRETVAWINQGKITLP